MTTGDALAGYLTKRSLIEAGALREDWYTGNWFTSEIRGRTIPIFPMAGFRSGLVHHDIHHMLTGYETSWIGECEVAGWELGSGGCGTHLVFWLDRLSFVVMGLVCAPLRTLRAFRRGLRAHNFFGQDVERVLSTPLAETERYAGSAISDTVSAPDISESSTREE